ncbi:MAG: hypothetical protein M1825_004794 [Sarcosagium campestre]|nr:MAG: hypothetical protein M1825_004794 [Sarcosagium campestre]
MAQKRKRIISSGNVESGPSSALGATIAATTTAAPSVKFESQQSKSLDTSKPTAVFKPTGPRLSTLSVAIPGSIIGKRTAASAQSHDLKTTLVGQIARALAVFSVDEVVVFDDAQEVQAPRQKNAKKDHGHHREDCQVYTGVSDPSHFLIHLLSYLETPPHLRRQLFPFHPNLRTAGTLPSLDMPHHLRADEWCRYREGISVTQADSDFNSYQSQTQTSKKSRKPHQVNSAPASSPSASDTPVEIYVGLSAPILVNAPIPPNTRVTLKFPSDEAPSSSALARGALVADAVSPSLPREEAGYYWGYSIRRAASLSTVLTESPFAGGYDVSVGTSERGEPLSDLLSRSRRGASKDTNRLNENGIINAAEAQPVMGKYRHLLVVIGGVAGLEQAVRADPELARLGVVEPQQLFDFWVDLCPGQGSRTIRAEEAVWMALMGLRSVVVDGAARRV